VKRTIADCIIEHFRIFFCAIGRDAFGVKDRSVRSCSTWPRPSCRRNPAARKMASCWGPQ